MPPTLQFFFEMPTLPFTVLVAAVTAYWLMMILGAIDLDFFDLDLDLDADAGIDVNADSSMLDWGMTGVRWLNIGEVPLMVWMSVFAMSAWGMSLYFDADMADATTADLLWACARNIGVGLLVAKAVTQPLRGRLKVVEPNKIEELLGRTCVVTTTEANEQFGQARCPADGAPLLLTIKTVDGVHPQGAEVEIVDYQPDEKTFLVRGTQESPASVAAS